MPDKLIIFIKNPILGKVKTRIAAGSDHFEALNIYLKLLENTRSVTSRVKANKHLFYSDYIVENDGWDNLIYTKHVQVSGDLGMRMFQAFRSVLSSDDKVIIIGSDCPYLSEEIINDAYALLDHSDVVLGPTFDGGYYLLGLKQLLPFVFEDLEWSTDTVLKTTIEKLEHAGLSWSATKKLNDIDTIEDWTNYLLQKNNN